MLIINITSAFNDFLALVRTPDNIIIAVIFAAFVILALVFYAVIFLINDYLCTKKVENKAPNTHKLLLDLQHEMLKEMRGTARQNKIMIELTILFILISIFGIIISVEGPQRSAHVAKQAVTIMNSAVHNALQGHK